MSKSITIRLPEPFLEEDSSRYTQLPVKYPEIQKMYKIHEAAFWTANEIDYQADRKDWDKLSNEERYFLENILAFFATADGIVVENLILNFLKDIKCPEARNFYCFQGAMENIHAQTYALLLDTYVKDPVKKKRLFEGIETIPCIKKKADWALKWMNDDRPFEERLIAFACVEGIYFSGSFCAIFWLKNQGKCVQAIGGSNELIARDEGLHTDFAVLIYQHLTNKVTQERVEEILRDAVVIEKEFICHSLPCKLIGMNSDLMSQYIEYVADRLLVQLGFKEIYWTKNPFGFMNKMCFDGKTNFFEKRTTEYQSSSSVVISKEDNWNLDDDF